MALIGGQSGRVNGGQLIPRLFSLSVGQTGRASSSLIPRLAWRQPDRLIPDSSPIPHPQSHYFSGGFQFVSKQDAVEIQPVGQVGV